MSGASGAPIAVRVLDALKAAKIPTALVVSRGGAAVLQEECGDSPEHLLHPRVGTVFEDDDLSAPIASGSRKTRGMVIVPCSTSTVAKVATGLADTLMTRAAAVHLKERRPLVLVPRETPLSLIVLRHLTALAEAGAVVLVAAPAYYTHPRTVEDQTDFIAGRVLDQLRIEHTLYRGWREGPG